MYKFEYRTIDLFLLCLYVTTLKAPIDEKNKLKVCEMLKRHIQYAINCRNMSKREGKSTPKQSKSN